MQVVRVSKAEQLARGYHAKGMNVGLVAKLSFQDLRSGRYQLVAAYEKKRHLV
jgi:hypothetical protein